MTGQILIIDAVSTNRIVLKAKLTAAFYLVCQTATAAEALRSCAKEVPDLILIGDLPAGTSMKELIQRLETACPAPAPPIVILAPDQDPEHMFSLLKTGATDVLGRPVDETILLARLRALIRQRRLDCDLSRHVTRAEAYGFAEDAPGFSRTGRIAVLAADKAKADLLCRRLDPLCRHELLGFEYQNPEELAHLSPMPDVVVLDIDPAREMSGMRCMAEWQAAPAARHMHVIARLRPLIRHLTVPMLDLGACDVVDNTRPDRDLAYRLNLHVNRKQLSDTLRGRLETGLQAAMVDPLTGLHNRRYAENFLRRMMDQAHQGGDSFAIMLADLDHFKAVNDTYGHAAGDLVLAKIASDLRAALPADAMIARVGGEEFLIAVPKTGPKRAKALAERLARKVRETPIEIAASTPEGHARHIHVTVSIGITLTTASAAPQTASVSENNPRLVPAATTPSLENLIAQADQALYTSKCCGRDTVTLRPAA